MRRQHRESRTRNRTIQFCPTHLSHKLHVGQTQLRSQLPQPAALRSIPRYYEAKVRHSTHGVQQVLHAFLGRQSAKVKQRSVLGWPFGNRLDGLEVGKNCELCGLPSMLHKFVAYKLAGSQKAIHAFSIRSQPFVNIGLRRQHYPRAPSRIALLLQQAPKFPTLASFACLPLRHQVVPGTEHLEVVQVIKNRNFLRFQLPQNRRRQMVIYISHVRHIGLEFRDHRLNPPPRLKRVDCLPGQPHLLQPSILFLEISVWHEVPIVGSGLPARIGHRKQRHFMPMGAQQFHSFEQVNLGATEGEVVLVAE